MILDADERIGLHYAAMQAEPDSQLSRRLLLGSASARRHRILRRMGVPFDIVVPPDEETSHDGDPERTVRENALRKSVWCRQHHPRRCGLTADTVVVFRGDCMEKPASLEQAREFLHRLSGTPHVVLTGTVFALPDSEPDATVTASTVCFKHLTDKTISRYFALVNPLDKAGAYDIDQHSDIFIDRYEGSWTNIMGLPEEVVAAWLRAHPEFAA